MAASDYEKFAGGDFTPFAKLKNTLGYLDAVVQFEKLVNPDEEDLMPGEPVMIGNEIMDIVSVIRNGREGSMTVKRGCADTTPRPIPSGVDVWFLRGTNTTMKEYAGGDEVAIKTLPYLPSSDTLAVEAAAPSNLKFNFRFARPYPPGQMRANGARWYSGARLTSDTPTLNLTWVHRNRVLQADKLFGHDEASVTPEIGQVYSFTVKDHNGRVVRNEFGIVGESVNYTWWQAVNDFDVGIDPTGREFIGSIYFATWRESYDSWTGYTIPLQLNNRSPFMYASLTGEQIGHASEERMMMPSAFASSVGEQTGQEDPLPSTHTMLVSNLGEGAGLLTAFFTQLTRLLTEAPYTRLLRQGKNPMETKVLTMVARPSDRLTDNHIIYSRNDKTHPWVQRDYPPFTPWLVIKEEMPFMTTKAAIRTTSLYDGVPLTEVRVGQMAVINDEIVRVVELTHEFITVARGCVDTVPAHQPAGARMWFIECGHGLSKPDGSWGSEDIVESKVLPAVYGPPLDPAEAATDKLEMARRVERPFPPGQVLINGRPWFKGDTAEQGKSHLITWVQRNRLSQGVNILDHLSNDVMHEPGTRYRFKISLKMPGPVPGKPVEVIIRQAMVDGHSFTYTYDMAIVDGIRASQLLKVCGYVVVPAYLDAVRDGLSNWQGYAMPLVLPAPACPINTNPGGGQGPWNPETPGGNGSTGGGGGNPSIPGTPGVDPGTDGPNPPDPGVDPKPPTWPPIPPDPIDPKEPGEPDPDDTKPDPGDTGEHWDYTWDIHWDAYRRIGGNDQGEG